MNATLRRTPLFDRHVAAGARLVPFAGWEMPVQYEGVIPEHVAVRTGAGAFDVSHMGQLHVEGPATAELLQSLLSNDVERLSDGEAQYTLLTNERGGIVDDLIVYRISQGHYLLVVNAGNREAAFEWLKDREARGTEVRDASDEYALVAVQGPEALERLGLPDAPAFTHAMGEVAGIEAMVCRTGYTGEAGVELLCPAEDGADLWDAVLERGVTPCGLGARDTLRLEVCYPLHGERHLAGDRRDLGRARLDVRARDGVHGRRGAAPREGGGARAEARRLRHGGEGRPTSGDDDRGRRRGHLRHPFALARRRHRDGIRAERAGEPRDRARPGRARQAPQGPCRQEADLPEGEPLVATESYPDDLRYHPEHDWARVDGDEAVLGITWYAQDALGELVHFEAPEVGANVTKDEAYAEVESVKAVSDVIAPLSGEVLEVNEKALDEPETINGDPYGDGWLVRIRLSDAGEVDSLLDPEAYRAHVAEQ